MEDARLARLQRLLVSVAESSTNSAPDYVLEAIEEAMLKVAGTWEIDEVVGRCKFCWREWDDCINEEGIEGKCEA